MSCIGMRRHAPCDPQQRRLDRLPHEHLTNRVVATGKRSTVQERAPRQSTQALNLADGEAGHQGNGRRLVRHPRSTGARLSAAS